MISDETGIPMEDLRRRDILSQFTMTPKGKYRISVCLGTALLCKRIGRYLQCTDGEAGHRGRRVYAGREFSLDACRCVGACGLAPVMMIQR